MGERDGVTKRYPLRGALGSGNPGDASDLERIALGIFEAAYRANDARGHTDESVGDGGPRCKGFRGNVDHVNFAAFVVMRKFGHRWPGTWSSSNRD